MNTAVVIPANPLAVKALAARYRCDIPMDVQVGMAALAKAIRTTMQQTAFYQSTPAPDLPLAGLDYDAPLESTAHPNVLAATLHNLAHEFARLTGGPIAIPNDLMVHVGGEWQYVANLVADIVDIRPPGTSPTPHEMVAPPMQHVGTATGHMEGSAPGTQNIPRTDPAVTTPTVAVGGLPEITLSPDQKGGSPGRPRKSLFETDIPLRVKGYSLPTWWPEFRDQAALIFNHTPADAIYVPSSRKTSPPQTYMLLLEILAKVLTSAPGTATVAELLTWIRGVEAMVAQSPSNAAIEQFRKVLREMENKQGGD
jgi:hypothetical protein